MLQPHQKNYLLRRTYNTMKRGDIPEKSGIEGSGCSDCCVSMWCPYCALIQQGNEVKGHQARDGVNARGYQAVTRSMNVPRSSYNGKDQEVLTRPLDYQHTASAIRRYSLRTLPAWTTSTDTSRCGARPT